MNKVRISIKRKDKNVNQIEITELKNIITKMKIQQRGRTVDQIKQKKELVHAKTGQ